MVTPEEFHQHSDSQAYADNVRPCAEMLFAALLEVRSAATRNFTACKSAMCCRSPAVCQLLLKRMAAPLEAPQLWRPHGQQSLAVPVASPQLGKFICSVATWGTDVSMLGRPPGCNSDSNFGAVKSLEHQPKKPPLKACWAQLSLNCTGVLMP